MWSNTGTGRPECGVSALGDIQDLIVHGPGQPALIDHALSRGLDDTISKGASNLDDFLIQCEIFDW